MARTNRSAANSGATPAKAAFETAESVAGETVQGINVRSFTPTFRRAGVEFTSEGRDFRLDDLSEEQIEAIASEPMLSVRGIELPALVDDLAAAESTGGTEAGDA